MPANDRFTFPYRVFRRVKDSPGARTILKHLVTRDAGQYLLAIALLGYRHSRSPKQFISPELWAAVVDATTCVGIELVVAKWTEGRWHFLLVQQGADDPDYPGAPWKNVGGLVYGQDSFRITFDKAIAHRIGLQIDIDDVIALDAGPVQTPRAPEVSFRYLHVVPRSAPTPKCGEWFPASRLPGNLIPHHAEFLKTATRWLADNRDEAIRRTGN